MTFSLDGENIRMLQEVNFFLYWRIAMATTIVCEHLGTLVEEIVLVWIPVRRVTIGTAIILVNRYTLLSLAIILLLGATSPHSTTSCEMETVFDAICQVILTTVAAATSALRVYALNDQTYILALSAFTLEAARGLWTIYLYSRLSFGVLYIGTVPVCAAIEHGSAVKYMFVTIVANTASMFAEVIVLAMTWLKTFRTARHVREAGTKMSVGMLLLRNGSLYFMSFLILFVAEMIMSTSRFAKISPWFVSTCQTFLVMIISILTTRFLFDLRQHPASRILSSTNVLRNDVPITDSRIIGDFSADLDLNIPITTADALSLDDDAVDDSDSPTAMDGENLTAGVEEGSERDPEVEEVH